MKTPQVNEDLIEWIEACHDTKPRKGDSDAILRWKGGQQDVLTTLRNSYQLQVTGSKEKSYNFKRKSDD